MGVAGVAHEEQEAGRKGRARRSSQQAATLTKTSQKQRTMPLDEILSH
jgi:hypothetical protein